MSKRFKILVNGEEKDVEFSRPVHAGWYEYKVIRNDLVVSVIKLPCRIDEYSTFWLHTHGSWYKSLDRK